MLGVSGGALVALEALALIGGIGITALGPGGVLVTIALYALTSLSPAHVAGTAIVTHVATGCVGSVAYLRSRQLRDPLTQRTALILAACAVLGAPVGVFVNTLVSRGAFSVLLGAFVAVTGVLVWRRPRPPQGVDGGGSAELHPQLHPSLIAGLGFIVAVISGLFGLGGPLLCVPLLVASGVPLLSALAAAQAQSIVIATVGTLGYLTQGAISWPLALAVAVPELVGVVIGWRIAHQVPTARLTRVLAVVLVAVAPYLILR